MSTAAGVHPGRPRDPRLDGALLQAATEIFLERGYHGATYAEIARRAGVGTPAIYRRWPDKLSIALDVVVAQAQPAPIPDTGSIRDDLAEFIRTRLRTLASPIFHLLILPASVEAWADPRLGARVRERFFDYRSPTMLPRIRRAIEAGQLRPDTSPDRLLDLLMGTIVVPLIFAAPLPTPAEAGEIVDQVLGGFAEP